MSEHEVIEQLTSYKRMRARIAILENYPIGNGITVSRLNQDDQLQDLHGRLRNMPSYMYLNKREQALETTAHAYLTKYPAGTKSQRDALPAAAIDPEDEKLLRELRRKIEKVIEARAGRVDDYDAVLERITELQQLKAEVEQIDRALKALAEYKPEYVRLIRSHFMDGRTWSEAACELNVSKDVFYRWRKRAVGEYEKIAK